MLGHPQLLWETSWVPVSHHLHIKEFLHRLNLPSFRLCSTGYDWLSGLQVHVCWLMSNFSSTSTNKSSPQSYSQPSHPQVCANPGDFPNSGAGPCTWHSSTSWGSHRRQLKPVRVPLADIPFLEEINCTSQLGVICRPAEGAHCVCDWCRY